MENNRTIQLRNAVIYQGDTLVLTKITLNMQQGEFAYLIGKTGSGKSTLLKAMYGELPLADGFGEVVGFDLNKLNWKKIPFLRRKLGIVFQDFQLLTDRTVNENLHFTLRATGWKNESDIKRRAETTLSMVGIKTKGFRMPHELSGGEQQRVVIARALLNKPALLLADEPTGNLDPETSNEIMQLLHYLSKQTQTAMIVATHDYTIIKKYPAKLIHCRNQTITENYGAVNL